MLRHRPQRQRLHLPGNQVPALGLGQEGVDGGERVRERGRGRRLRGHRRSGRQQEQCRGGADGPGRCQAHRYDDNILRS
jgi:hypothetical protein